MGGRGLEIKLEILTLLISRKERERKAEERERDIERVGVRYI